MGIDYKTVMSKFPDQSRGSNSAYVGLIQCLLCSYDEQFKEKIKSFGIDCDFGGTTEALVCSFQEREGLGVDGIVGDETWGAFANLSKKSYINGLYGQVFKITYDDAFSITKMDNNNTGVTTNSEWYYCNPFAGSNFFYVRMGNHYGAP